LTGIIEGRRFRWVQISSFSHYSHNSLHIIADEQYRLIAPLFSDCNRCSESDSDTDIDNSDADPDYIEVSKYIHSYLLSAHLYVLG